MAEPEERDKVQVLNDAFEATILGEELGSYVSKNEATRRGERREVIAQSFSDVD
jgi:hypothetical protein